MTAAGKRHRIRQPLGRLLKFSLVGSIGIGVQLAMLATLTHWGMNYLLATALAVELAVLQNFLWHQYFTWADRPGSGLSQAFLRLFRFHLSNGAISLAGNLLMMRLLVGWLGVPVVIANVITISTCSLANLLASDRWVFLAAEEVGPPLSLEFEPAGQTHRNKHIGDHQTVADRSRMSSSVRCAKGT